MEKEFGKLEDGDEVFKLMGPVLVKQEVEEAKINVQKRVEFIKSEMWVRRTRSMEVEEEMVQMKIEWVLHSTSSSEMESRFKFKSNSGD